MYKGILILFTLLLSFSACSIKEDERGGPVVTDEKIRFELFTKTGAYGLPVARASASETAVDQGIWVLVFRGTDGNAEFVEAVQADELNGKTYVYLTESSDACRLLILANPWGICHTRFQRRTLVLVLKIRPLLMLVRICIRRH